MVVAVFHLGSLGDSVIAIPALRAMRQHFGESARIILFHERGSPGKVTPRQVMEASVRLDEYMAYEASSNKIRQLWSAFQLWMKVRRLRVDMVFYLVTSERNARLIKRDRFFFQLCGVKQLFGFQSQPLEQRAVRQNGRVVQYLSEMSFLLKKVKDSGIPADSALLDPPFLNISLADQQAADVFLKMTGFGEKDVWASLCPGTNMSSKRWDQKRWGEIVRRLASRGIRILLVGSLQERSECEALATLAPGAIVAAGSLSPLATAVAVARCRFHMGVDNGVGHLAGAMGIPCLELYSERNYPGQWDPPGKGHILLRNPVPCQGCQKKICPLEMHPCMNGISVERVWDAVEAMIQSTLCSPGSE